MWPGLSCLPNHNDMADTLQTPPQAPPASDRLEAPPAARRFRWLKDGWLATLFVSPAMAILIFLSIGPLIWLILLSFTDYSATRDVGYNWIGFENYVDVLTSPVVHERAVTTALFVAGAILLQTTLGFAIAYLISRRVRGRGALTTMFLVPMMLSPIVVGLFWKFMLDTQFGVVNSMLASLGFDRVEWLTQQRMALISLIVVDTWQWTPFIMLIALAGLTAVPKYLYEAAEIDRASEWTKFWRITLPMVMPFIILALLFRSIENFKMFDLVDQLTNGGPGSVTELASIHLKREAFEKWRTGYSSALAIILFVSIYGLSLVAVRWLERVKQR